MNWFRDLRTVNKIIFLVVVMLLFIMSAGFTGYYYKEKARNRLETLYNDRLLAIQYLYDARLHNRAIETYLYEIITSSDISKEEISQADIRTKKLEFALKKYKKTYLEKYEKERQEKLNRLLNKIIEVERNTIQKELSGIQGLSKEYFLQNDDYFKQMTVLLRELASFNQEYAYHIKEQNDIDAIIANRIILITILIAVILSFLTVLFISKEVDFSIKKILLKMNLISEGELDVSGIQIKSKNEFGQLDIVINKMAEEISDKISREKFLRGIILSSIMQLDIKDVQKSIVTKAGRYFDADRCLFAEYNENTGDFNVIKENAQYTVNSSIQPVTGLQLKKDELANIAKEKVIKNRETIFVRDIEELEDKPHVRDIIKKFKPKSFMMAPVVYKNKLLGLLIVDTVNDYKDYDDKAIELFSTVANQIAVIYAQVKLYQKLQIAKSKEAQLREIISKALSCDSLNSALEVILSVLKESYDMDYIDYRTYEEKDIRFHLIKSLHDPQDTKWENFKGVILDRESRELFLKQLQGKNEPIIIKNRHFYEDNPGVKSILDKFDISTAIFLPCSYQNHPLGLIVLLKTEEKQDWKNEDIQFLNLLMPVISATLSVFHLNEKLKRSFNIEKALREIIVNIKSTSDEAQIYNYIMQKMVNVFDAEGIMYFSKQGESIKILYEYMRIKGKENTQKIFYTSVFNNFYSGIDAPLMISDVAYEVENEELKELLLNNDIHSFMLCPIGFVTDIGVESSSVTACLIYSSKKGFWSDDMLTYFSFMVDTINLLYLEIKQRQFLEETKKNFIATLTHDLRSPLIAVQKALEAIMIKRPETPIGEFVEYLEDIHSTNEDLLRLINNLLSVYHYESGKYELDMRANNVAGLINDAVRSLRYLAESRDCEIVFEVLGDIPAIVIDGPEIKRVFMNLIGNAIKHTQINTKIKITAQRVDAGVLIAISDNGPGIKEEDAKDIFSRYQTKKRKVGSGLGLYLSKQIVEAHNGRIWFESELDKGTTFYVLLPYTFG